MGSVVDGEEWLMWRRGRDRIMCGIQVLKFELGHCS